MSRLLSVTLVLSALSVGLSFQSLHRLSQRKLVKPDLQMAFGDASLLTSILQRVEPSQAKSEFFFFFFGGSGALGLGFKQFPTLIAEAKKVKSFANGISEGGEDLECSPLATIGYPEKMKIADVKKVIAEIPDMREIYDAGPKKNYIAEMGYLERDGLNALMPECNPLVLYATFDAMARGGGDCANPAEALAMVEAWRAEGGIEAWKQNVQNASVKKWSAYVTFYFLIFVVFDLVIESGANAFL